MEDEGSSNWSDWAEDGDRGPPPWRRAFGPPYFVTSVALLAGLLTVWLAASGRLP
jgi:hypothetical protein